MQTPNNTVKQCNTKQTKVALPETAQVRLLKSNVLIQTSANTWEVATKVIAQRDAAFAALRRIDRLFAGAVAMEEYAMITGNTAPNGTEAH
jgi:hypothetical protein